MAYTPPVGTANLVLPPGYFQQSGYTPPVGTADLIIGYDPSTARFATEVGETLAPTGAIALLGIRQAALAGETLAPTGAIALLGIRQAALAGETLAPTGLIQAILATPLWMAGETLAPVGRLDVAYDPNLLSAVHSLAATAWQDGDSTPYGIQEPLQAAPDLRIGDRCHWQTAALLGGIQRDSWQDSPSLAGAGFADWQAATSILDGRFTGWKDSLRLDTTRSECWGDAGSTTASFIQAYRPRLPLPEVGSLLNWRDGESISRHVSDGMQDGLLILAIEIEGWQQAGYPGNAPNPGPPLPPPPAPTPWGTALRIGCPLPGTALRIGRTPCVLIAEREIPLQRTYMSTNSAALVRWPDLTPLPCTAISVETDFESWCWALSATLVGPDAWALVQPDPLACQVQATINGQVWRFLLDVPSTQRSFNSDRVSLKGRSRSAWLQAPYASQQDFSVAVPREMQQLADAALENTGWSVDWQLDNWVVPAGLWTQYSTPIDVLLRLAAATDDGIYTQPTEQIITLHKRWPVASWLLDAETTDLLIPEAAVISLSQAPVYTQPLNGVYVSGTTAGALALVKIAGTDGALQPAEPLAEALLCDAAGVAARRRGLNALSDSGAGWEMDAELLFTPEIGLVRPGLIVSIAGLKGISRSCRISAQWSGAGLSVRQSVGLERREVEA